MAEIDGLRMRLGGWRARVRWQANARMVRRPDWIVRLGMPLTVLDLFGALGDTLMASSFCRQLKERHPGLRVHLLTPNPALVEGEPHLDAVNVPETYWCVWFEYLGIVARRDAGANVMSEPFAKVGMRDFEYRCRVTLREEERLAGEARWGGAGRPRVVVATRSSEVVKNWPEAKWRELVRRLAPRCAIGHMGGADEPELPGVERWAGRLSLRESMGALAAADLFVGPDTFLMHAANGLGVPGVILFGGSRTPANLGYAGNTNLFVAMECSGCWIHGVNGESCPRGIECMERLAVEAVEGAVRERLGGGAGCI